MIMEESHYLTSEVLNHTNYPEVLQMEPDIGRIFAFAMEVDSKTLAYNQGKVNRIDLNMSEVEGAVEQCRTVCEVLGNAPKVCFDLLLDLRALQGRFQDLLFLKRRFGDEYIGTPTPPEDFGAEGGIG